MFLMDPTGSTILPFPQSLCPSLGPSPHLSLSVLFNVAFCLSHSLSRSSFRVTPKLLRVPVMVTPDQSGNGHSEAFGVITRVVFPEVRLPRLAKVHTPDTIDSSSSSPSPSPSSSLAINGQQQQPPGGIVATTGNTTATTNPLDAEKEEAAAEAELLDTLVGLVALKGGAEGAPQHGAGAEGIGAQGGSLGHGRYRAVLSEGRESAGKAEESTLLNLLFVPDGRWDVDVVGCGCGMRMLLWRGLCHVVVVGIDECGLSWFVMLLASIRAGDVV